MPDWIVQLTAWLAQAVGGRLVLAGFTRGAKWCHEIIGQLITMKATMPLRCLLVAPYCKKSWTEPQRMRHASAIRCGPTTVTSICSSTDNCCSWKKYGNFISMMGEVIDVQHEFPSNQSLLEGFVHHRGNFLDATSWLVGTNMHT